MPPSIFVFSNATGAFVLDIVRSNRIDPPPPVPPIAENERALELHGLRTAPQTMSLNRVRPRRITVRCAWSRRWIQPMHRGRWPPDGVREVWPDDCVVGIDVTTEGIPDGTPVTVTVHHCPTRDDCPGNPVPDPAAVLADPSNLLANLVVMDDRVVRAAPPHDAPTVTPVLDINPVRTAAVAQATSRTVTVTEVVSGNQVPIVFPSGGFARNVVTAVPGTAAAAIDALLQPILQNRRAMWDRNDRLSITVTGESGNTRRDTRVANVTQLVTARFDHLVQPFLADDTEVRLPDGVARPAMLFDGATHALWPAWRYPFYFFRVRIHLGQNDRVARGTDLQCYSPSRHWTSAGIEQACLRLAGWHVFSHDYDVTQGGNAIAATLNGSARGVDHSHAFHGAGFRGPLTSPARWGEAVRNTYAAAQQGHGRVYNRVAGVEVPRRYQREYGGWQEPTAYQRYCYRWIPRDIDYSRLRSERERRARENEIFDWIPGALTYGTYRSVILFGHPPDQDGDPEPTAIGDAEIAAHVPIAPKYLLYLNNCRSAAEPSLARAFLARGTHYVIGFRRPARGAPADAGLEAFFRAWHDEGFNPGLAVVRRLFIQHVQQGQLDSRPVLSTVAPQDGTAMNALAIDAALTAIYDDGGAPPDPAPAIVLNL